MNVEWNWKTKIAWTLAGFSFAAAGFVQSRVWANCPNCAVVQSESSRAKGETTSPEAQKAYKNAWDISAFLHNNPGDLDSRNPARDEHGRPVAKNMPGMRTVNPLHVIDFEVLRQRPWVTDAAPGEANFGRSAFDMDSSNFYDDQMPYARPFRRAWDFPGADNIGALQPVFETPFYKDDQIAPGHGVFTNLALAPWNQMRANYFVFPNPFDRARLTMDSMGITPAPFDFGKAFDWDTYPFPQAKQKIKKSPKATRAI